MTAKEFKTWDKIFYLEPKYVVPKIYEYEIKEGFWLCSYYNAQQKNIVIHSPTSTVVRHLEDNKVFKTVQEAWDGKKELEKDGKQYD